MSGDCTPSIDLSSISIIHNSSISISSSCSRPDDYCKAINNKSIRIQGSLLKNAELSMASRRLVCRYGRGCTHSNDLVHKEQYWHPPLKDLECKLLCVLTYLLASSFQLS